MMVGWLRWIRYAGLVVEVGIRFAGWVVEVGIRYSGWVVLLMLPCFIWFDLWFS